jgi:ornithine--oxo-acid transaminase
MVKEVRGEGLMSGIEFVAPRQMGLRIAFKAFKRIHAGMFGQMLVMRLFREKNILTQICGNNFMVLKVAPPLVATTQQCDEFVEAVGDVVEAVHSSGAFWSDSLGLARRALEII